MFDPTLLDAAAVSTPLPLTPEQVDALGGPECLAAWLERSGDYKVLRRLRAEAMVAGLAGRELREPLPVLVVDTETTGLDAGHAELIEVGMVLLEVDRATGETGRILAQYGGLEQPTKPIPPESTAVHGITDAMVEGQRFDDAVVLDLLRQAKLCVAHNAVFDRAFMVQRFPEFSRTTWACTLQELPWYAEGYASRKLESLLAERAVFHGAHRAVEDCFALVHVLSGPLKQSGCQPWALLLESAEQDIYRIAAVKAPFEKKDVLKARGFSWNKDDRVWEYQAIGFAQGKELIEWLRAEVYQTAGKIELGFCVQAGAQRYAGLGEQDLGWRKKLV